MTILDLEEEKLKQLEAQLCKERTASIEARKRQGLDAIWSKARKQYQGISVENRGSLSSMEKGETLDSALTSVDQSSSTSKGSTVVVNITRPYTNAGTARVADILLPTNKLPFEFKQTPVSDIEILRSILKDFPTVMEVLPELTPELNERLTVAEDVNKEALKKATKLIKDWLKESNWSYAVRKQIIEAGKVGTGIIKGPFPKARKLSKDIEILLDSLPTAVDDPSVGTYLQNTLRTLLEFTPHIESIKVENCYPDAECGTDIQNGNYFYERVPEVTKTQLKEYKEDSSYDSEQIDLCLDEGPKSPEKKDDKAADKSKGSFELWIRTGTLECKIKDEIKSFGFQVTTLCNDHIIKSETFWLETPIIPYWVLTWEPRDNSWTGIGVPEIIETSQRGLDSSVRALMDNMGYSVGPQVIELDGVIEPVEGEDWEMRPYKRWRVKSSLPGQEAVSEAKSALSFLEFPNYLNEIMPVIQYWIKMAEDTTGLSLLLQGQASTDAVGVSQQLMSNATTNLRLVIKEWDDKTCYPMMTAFYEWAQLYGPSEVKGDAVVEPLGSSALIVRELQQQALLQIGDKTLQPIYGISPKKWMNMYLEGFQIDSEVLAMTPEELDQLKEAEKQPDPRIIVAQIEAQAEVYKADLKKEVDTLKLALEDEFNKMAADQAKAAELLNAQVKVMQGLINKQPEGSVKAPEILNEGQAQGQLEELKPAPIVEDDAVDVDNALNTLGL
jgi:hypothetical protein